MAHLPDLITDLGFILITAAVVTLIFRRLKQPAVLGYLVAGFLLSPHISFIPTVRDTESIRVWGEIGVIFLLFGLGLEFSFKKLLQVGRSASIVALVEVLFMLGLGYLTGKLFGWSDMDSLFLGGILSISSTTIIARAFEELGFKTKRFVGLVYGVLIVEDLFAILLLVLLSTVAATKTLSGTALAQSSFKLAFFLILWFMLGSYLVPTLLQKIRRYLNKETTLIVSIGLCLLMVILATAAGFSPALGAFIMGSLLAETREGHAIEETIMPVKDLFAAVFFVSVGMLIDPKILWEHGGLVVAVTLLTIFGKLISTSLGALIAGQNLRDSVRAGMSLAQIGEFSFIIAGLGLTLGVTSDFLSPVAIAVSAITTFTTPYLIQLSGPFHSWIERRLPNAFLATLERYHSATSRPVGEGLGQLLWKLYGMKLLFNSVLIVAIALSVRRLLLPEMQIWLGGSPGWLPLLGLITTLALCAPFFWPIVFGLPSKSFIEEGTDLLRVKALLFGLTTARLLVGLLLFGFIAAQFSSAAAVSSLSVLVLGALTISLSRRMKPIYQFFERRLLLNLQDRDLSEKQRERSKPELAPWDASLAELVLSPDSEFVAKTLLAAGLKERFGVTVALIERGQKQIIAPGRQDLLLPGDRIYMIGTEDQLESARAAIELRAEPNPEQDDSFGLDFVSLRPGSSFLGRPIRESGLRERIHGLIVGLEREGRRILSPDSSMILQEGDLLWMVGDRLLMKELKGEEKTRAQTQPA